MASHEPVTNFQSRSVQPVAHELHEAEDTETPGDSGSASLEILKE
jgi:hypothetical protein